MLCTYAWICFCLKVHSVLLYTSRAFFKTENDNNDLRNNTRAMVLIRAKSKDVGLLRRRRGGNGSLNNEQLVLLLLTFVFVGYLVYSVYTGAKSIAERNRNNGGGGASMVRKADQQKAFAAGQDSRSVSLHLDRMEAFENADYMDAEAADIRRLLKCDVLLENQKSGYVNGYYFYGAQNDEDEDDKSQSMTKDGAGEGLDHSNSSSTTDGTTSAQQQRRRLSLGEEGQTATTEGIPIMEDDLYPGDMYGDGIAEITAAHLFCLAAYTANDAIVKFWQDKIKCPVLADEDTHKGLIDLWSTVRSEILDETVLTKTLSLSTERYISLAHQALYVWAPPGDVGTSYMTASLQQQGDEKEGIGNLHDNLGKDRLFVDMGSGLGYTAMTVSLLYPGTTIVSMEAAPTNWLLQKLNWRCNNVLPRPKAVLKEGVAPSSKTSQVAHFIWRPTSTSSTRAWSLNMEDEHKNSNRNQDIEFSVQLLPWHKLLLLAEIVDQYVCTGYNVFNCSFSHMLGSTRVF
jgi:hypothetical protein